MMAEIAPGHHHFIFYKSIELVDLFVKVSSDLWICDVALIVVVETCVDKVLWNCLVAYVVNERFDSLSTNSDWVLSDCTCLKTRLDVCNLLLT
ncbi:MAG: hypothetical protein RL470_794 [Actinomycetota bacterium]